MPIKPPCCSPLTRPPSPTLTAAAYLAEYLRGWRVKTSPVPIKPAFFTGIKSNNYLPNALAVMDAQAEGFDQVGAGGHGGCAQEGCEGLEWVGGWRAWRKGCTRPALVCGGWQQERGATLNSQPTSPPSAHTLALPPSTPDSRSWQGMCVDAEGSMSEGVL